MSSNSLFTETHADLVYDGGSVTIPECMGTPREDQMQGTPLEQLVELSGRICYDSIGKGRSSQEYHAHILEVGHRSVLEHATLTMSAIGLDWSMFVNRPGVFVQALEGTSTPYRLTINLRAVEEWDRYSHLSILRDKEMERVDKVGFRIRELASRHAPQIVLMPGEYDVTPGGVGLCEGANDRERWVSMVLGMSRACSHEWVRHRYQSAVSQRSTRFIKEDDTPFVLHPVIRTALGYPSDPGISKVLEDAYLAGRSAYTSLEGTLRDSLKKQGLSSFDSKKQARGAARGPLGNALYTRMIYSASVWQWKNIIGQRLTKWADAEIREVAAKALEQLKKSRYALSFEGISTIPSPDGMGVIIEDE